MIKVTLALEWFRHGIREDNWCWDRCDQCEGECWIDGGECHKEYLEVSKWKWIGYAWIRCWYKPWSWFIPYDIWERSIKNEENDTVS